MKGLLGRSLAATSAAILIAGCGGSEAGSSGSGGSSSSSPAIGDVNDALIGISCSDTAITLVALPAAGGPIAARRDIPLVDGVTPTFGCGSHPYAVRQIFNRDYTRMAVTITNSSDRSRHVGYVNVDSGKVVDLNADSTGDFAAAAQNDSPVYDPASGNIWYLDRNESSGAVLQRVSPVKAVGPDGGPPTTVGSWGGDAFVIEGTSGNLTGFTSSKQLPLPNPSGTADAEYNSIRPSLSLQTADEGKELLSIKGLDGLPSTEERGLPARGTVPLAWVDDSTLITATDISTTSNTTASAMQLFRFSDNLRSVLSTSPLIPDSDRTNVSPVVSPDHDSVIFISGRGNTAGIYRVKISSDAVEPTPLPKTPVPAKLLEWR